MVAAISHSDRHTPGVVDGGGAWVVVVVVEMRLVVASVLNSTIGLVAVAFLWASRSFSIENGVVDGEGQPVNSVEALKNICCCGFRLFLLKPGYYVWDLFTLYESKLEFLLNLIPEFVIFM